MLKVRFAEVNRSAMQELGVNFFGGPTGDKGWMGRSTTGQFPAPSLRRRQEARGSRPTSSTSSDSCPKMPIGATVQALKGRGLFESLAEPNLVTQDGKEASFLAGGEFPYPVVQGGGANQSVTIVFKEFGVRLRFTPTLTGGGFIHLKVVPEVSSLDFGNAVTLEGFRVPALKTRRTETEVELRDGQTFAISGLLDRNMDETLRRVPGIGDIPILGYLFRSQAYQKNNTELVVMITPHIVRRDSPGVSPNLPGLVEPFLAAPSRTIPMPPPAFSSMAPDSPAGPARTVVSNARACCIHLARRLRDRYGGQAQRTVASVAPVAPSHPLHRSRRKTRARRQRTARTRSGRRKKLPGSSANRQSVRARTPRSKRRAQARRREEAEERARDRAQGRRRASRRARRSSKRSASRSRPRSIASAGSNSRSRPAQGQGGGRQARQGAGAPRCRAAEDRRTRGSRKSERLPRSIRRRRTSSLVSRRAATTSSRS